MSQAIVLGEGTQVSVDVQARVPEKVCGGGSHFMRVSKTGLLSQ